MTTYVAYLVFAENHLCWVYDDPAEVSIGLVGSNNGQNRTVYIHREQQDGDHDGFYPKMRADGWLETELGEFFNGDNENSEFLITIKSEMKEGLLIQGIEIRPKKSVFKDFGKMIRLVAEYKKSENSSINFKS
ncbi:hypothetical protein Ddye_018282 [Dipteronia dyeriana]|uniref:Uncharacterized protein n=1 Tax=Dipteronia dyeriana TaxID=168575 RepID=A0AAD9X1M7_9ROSI|nr:hypothetical protein Ddye_018282 [Dipteronia dyeriana]